MLDDVCAFLARYLHCSPEQRTVLALWILHTHSFAAARSTPYLAIQSAHKLSGKSRCLRLLSLLSAHPELTSGYTASTLVHRIHSRPNELPTFLLDESPSTLGSRSRSRNPKLRAILVSGFQPGIGYSDRSFECTIFSPKAFASLGPLPEALADCSIPIVLEPMRDPDQSGIKRFDLLTAGQEAQPLVAALQNWSRKNISALKSARAFKYKDFPQRLTWRGQDLVEPLLQLADQVGGDYPARARHALLHLFDDPARQQQDIATQLLRDLRDCFKFHNYPERIATAVLVEWLHGLPSRPWDVDGSITPQKFARLLAPFQIKPRLQRMGKNSSARGYQLEDFRPHWQKHLALDPASGTRAEKSEITNKNAGCNTVTDAGAASEISAGQRRSAAIDSGVDAGVSQGPTLGEAGLRAEPNDRGAGKFTGNSGHLSGGERSDKTNNDAASNTVTEAEAAPDPMAWLPPILMPSDSASYNYGPHSDWDVKIIRHFGAQGYKALSEMEARRIEFSCGNLPFGTMAPRTSLAYPAMPVRSFKRAEPPMTDEERAAAWEKIRRDRNAPPKCAERENFRLAPQRR